MELMASSWRSSFCGAEAHQTPDLSIATARAGNVIGGGGGQLIALSPTRFVQLFW